MSSLRVTGPSQNVMPPDPLSPPNSVFPPDLIDPDPGYDSAGMHVPSGEPDVASGVGHSDLSRKMSPHPRPPVGAHDHLASLPYKVGEWWKRLASPPTPQLEDRWQLSAQDLDRYRRGRLFALVMAGMCIGSLLATPLYLVQFLTVPDISTFLDAVTTPAVLILSLTFVRLNHAGHVALAGILSGTSFCALLAANLVIGDLFVHGYTWADVPGWMLMALGPQIIALTAKPWQAGITGLGFCLLLLAIVLFVPQQPSVLATDIASQLGAYGLPVSQTTLPLDVDLLARPFILVLATVLMGIAGNVVAIQALRGQDNQEQRAHYQQRIAELEARQVQLERLKQRWGRKAIALQQMALSGGWKYNPPDLPDETPDDPLLLDIRHFLESSSHRIQDLQLAALDIKHLTRHFQLFRSVVEQQLRDGTRAEDGPRLDELEQIALLPGAPLSPDVATMLLEMRDAFAYIANGDSQVRRAIKDAIRDRIGGNRKQRVSASLESARLGDLVVTVNWLFAELDAMSSEPGQPNAEATDG